MNPKLRLGGLGLALLATSGRMLVNEGLAGEPPRGQGKKALRPLRVTPSPYTERTTRKGDFSKSLMKRLREARKA